MATRYTLNKSAANQARLHKEGLATVYRELPEPFKSREAKQLIDEWDDGVFLKLSSAGLLESEDAGYNEPNDWYLSQQAKRWLKQELPAAN